MFHIFNINEHLDSDEKVMLFFRPSRKAYIFQYIIYVALLALAVWLWLYIPSFFSIPFLYAKAVASLALMLTVIILFLNTEYRIWSRRYALTNERIMYSRGILSEQFKSTAYKNITDIEFEQSLWDKIMDTGTLKIDTAGTANYEIRYRKISHPLDVKRKINDLVPNKKN